VQAKE